MKGDQTMQTPKGVPESDKLSPKQVNGPPASVRRRNRAVIPEKFGYIFRPKRWWERVLLSGTVCGIEFCYSAETAFVTPVLLSFGLSIRFVTLMWCLSPLVGFFLTPVLGSMSDTCESRLGRRRPFILVFSVGILLGLLLVPNGSRIGLALGDPASPVGNTSTFAVINSTNFTDATPVQPWSIAFTVIGTILMDFNSDACQAPSRTYLLDVSLPSDHSAGLTTFTLMAGVGGALGYVIGAIDWENTLLGSWIGSQVDTVFTIVTLAFIFCMVLSVSTFPEIPLSFFKDEKLNRAYQEKLQAAIRLAKKDDMLMNVKVKKYGSTGTKERNDRIGDESSNLEISQATNKSCDIIDLTENKNNQIALSKSLHQDQNPKLKDYLKSIVQMPTSIKILCLTSLFCWMSLVCYTLYFTDFVGSCVFGGHPRAREDSAKFQLYRDGVRFGCWGLALFSLSCAIYSYYMDSILKKIGAKKAYIGGQLVFTLGMGFMAFSRHKLAVILMSPTAGIMQASLLTIPYLLIANYHSENQFSDKVEESATIRGMGTDIAALSSTLFLAQLLLSLTMGWIVDAAGSTVASVIASAVLSACGALCATRVMYFDA